MGPPAARHRHNSGLHQALTRSRDPGEDKVNFRWLLPICLNSQEGKHFSWLWDQSLEGDLSQERNVWAERGRLGSSQLRSHLEGLA